MIANVEVAGAGLETVQEELDRVTTPCRILFVVAAVADDAASVASCNEVVYETDREVAFQVSEEVLEVEDHLYLRAQASDCRAVLQA